MAADDGGPFYTYRGAAQKVGRDVSTVRRWAVEWEANGELGTDSEGRRIVSHQVLMRTYREKLDANSAHQRKLARILREAGT